MNTSQKPLETREFKYLQQQGSKKVGAETYAKLNGGDARLDAEPLYVRTKIAGGGEIDLLTSSLNESVGVTNIDKMKLPKFINFILSKISFGYASAAPGTKAAEALVYSNMISDLPPELQNADLIIKQNDQPLCTFPIKTFLKEDKIRHVFGDAGYELPYIVTIKEDVKFQVSIKFPTGLSLSNATDNFVEVFLKGSRTKTR